MITGLEEYCIVIAFRDSPGGRIFGSRLTLSIAFEEEIKI